MKEVPKATRGDTSALLRLKRLPKPGAYAIMAILALLVVGSAFVVVQNAYEKFGLSQPAQSADNAAPGTAGIANPASVYCESLGGRTRDVDTPAGQAGYCDLPDGRTCDEWRLFNSNSTECINP